MDLFLCRYLEKYVDEETTRLISEQPSRRRYVLMLIPKLISLGEQECIDKCNQIVDFIDQHSPLSANNDRYLALQIHKLISCDNEQVAKFANNINKDSLRKILCEDRVLVDADMDIIPRIFITQVCNICGNNKFELMENELKNYYACSKCWMPKD